jgi:hypothetical protein
MNLDKLFSITERLRMRIIGEPTWISKKNVFEYSNQSLEVVVILKIIRAAQGIKSLQLLCENGLFIDMGAIYRCVGDCTAEVYFLLEHYPETSEHINRFVKAFFETTIDRYLNMETEYVPAKKIHSAVVRVLTNSEQSETLRASILKIYKTFSGYTHANYCHIMQIYGGMIPNRNFNLSGVPSIQQREMHLQLVEAAYLSVLYSIGFAAHKFGLTDILKEISDSISCTS